MPGRKVKAPLLHAVSFKLPADLYDRLAALAVKESRSFAAQSVRIVEIYLANVEACESLRRKGSPPHQP